MCLNKQLYVLAKVLSCRFAISRKVKLQLHHSYLAYKQKSGLVFSCILTCLGSEQCSHVRRKEAGPPLGSKLGVRRLENLFRAHTAPELSARRLDINIYWPTPQRFALSVGVWVLTGCSGPLWDTVTPWRKKFILTEAAVLVRLEIFICCHALHQTAHSTPGRLKQQFYIYIKKDKPKK